MLEAFVLNHTQNAPVEVAQVKHENFFSSFNLCPSLLSVAIDDGKRCQCLNIVLNNKSGLLMLEFN